MTNKAALQTLLAKVEAGACCNDGQMFKAFGDKWLPCFDAYNGSLDAAHSLHKAVLGDRWFFTIKQQRTVGNRMCVEVTTTTQNGGNRDYHYGYHADNPARAWLIAIIEALIAETEQ